MDGVYNAEFFGPEAGNPSQDERGDFGRHRQLWFLVRDTVQGIGGGYMDSHGDANSKAAEKVDQDHLMLNPW
uniref:Uncharacterized protein n=1 Tax=Romanomermis culicivorax TaxID=13658 RepID=A0A915KSG2_ROMCU